MDRPEQFKNQEFASGLFPQNPPVSSHFLKIVKVSRHVKNYFCRLFGFSGQSAYHSTPPFSRNQFFPHLASEWRQNPQEPASPPPPLPLLLKSFSFQKAHPKKDWERTLIQRLPTLYHAKSFQQLLHKLIHRENEGLMPKLSSDFPYLPHGLCTHVSREND